MTLTKITALFAGLLTAPSAGRGATRNEIALNVRFWRISLKNSLDWLFIRPISFFRAAYQCFCDHAAAQGLKSCGSHAAITPYGGVCGLSFASLLRFCAVAASRNSSRAPHGPRSRRRAILRMRLRCAKSILHSGNQDETLATIWMRFLGRGRGQVIMLIVAL